MKTLRTFFSDARRHKGLALIIVLSMLALATIVILAFLSVADTEHKGTMTYSASMTARRLADTATNLVIAQIRTASDQNDTNSGREFHATQPGAVRQYNEDGAFLAGYKLYSDDRMIFTRAGSSSGNDSVIDERAFVFSAEPPATWNQANNVSRYVDLNEPVVKGVVSAASGTVGGTEVYFPILDPRAAYDMDASTGNPYPAEGFFYETTTALSGADISRPGATDGEATKISAVVKPSGSSSPDSLRLAMPVQWLYMLKDGTLGTLNEGLQFTSSGSVPSEINPIVGRIAFWADDESCKVNINTASEPTFTGQPTYYHERDHRWADYPPALGEYQRFPGHPATVALSSVLYPNPTLDANRSLTSYGQSAGSRAENLMVSVKNRIYDLVPRIAQGGSRAGTKLFGADDFVGGGGTTFLTQSVNLNDALQERLYASVDELFFGRTNNGEFRTVNPTSTDGGDIFNKQTLERASGFLTASSRASEISMLGLPRIAMWPVHTSTGRRTGFDSLINFCSIVGSDDNDYIFKRQIARDPTTDINIPRNKSLLNMLDQIMLRAKFPSATTNAGSGGTFDVKLGGVDSSYRNSRQVLVEMFDYIRSTNLQDSYLVPANRANWPSYAVYWGDDPNQLGRPNIYNQRDGIEDSFLTFTPGVVTNINASTASGGVNNPFNDVALPGHGQVSAATWNIGGLNYRGFGRTVSISEIGLQFICTADGQPDMYSWRIPRPGQAGFEIETNIPSANGSLPLNFSGNANQAFLNALDDAANPGGGPTTIITGGRTALRIEPNPTNIDTTPYLVEHERTTGFNFLNTQQVFWNDGYGNRQPNLIKKRYYSNFPPLKDPSFADQWYGTARVDPQILRKPYNQMTPEERKLVARNRDWHPGVNPENWNRTLEQNTPLTPKQKRIQAMFHLEFFCPSVGYTQVSPEFTIVIQAAELNAMKVETQTLRGTKKFEDLFPRSASGYYIIKSGSPLFATDGAPQVGGYASFRRLIGNRGFPSRGENMPADTRYTANAPLQGHLGIMNMDLVSDFFTVDARNNLNIISGTNPITIRVYESHNWQNIAPSQTIQCNFKNTSGMPTPDLVVQPSHRVFYIADDTTEYEHPAVQAPHWWCFNQGGVFARNPVVSGRGLAQGTRQNNDGTSARGNLNVPTSPIGGTQRLPGSSALIYGGDNNTYASVRIVDNRGDPADIDKRWSKILYQPNNAKPELSYNILQNHFGTDVIRTLVPGHGDARLIAAKFVVGEKEWSPHPLFNSPGAYMAHNFSSYRAGSEPGFDVSGDATSRVADTTRRVLPGRVQMSASLSPDAVFSGPANEVPNQTTKSLNPAFLAQRYYDFDETDPGGRIGTFINKADEGNFAVGQYTDNGWPQAKTWRATYFSFGSGFGAKFAPGAPSFFTPNRMVSSPVIMGSLPSRVYNPNMLDANASIGGNGAWTNLLFRPHVRIAGAQATHPGQTTPPDHYLLDMFWMPVVEPYAISEPLSTAGKINMNYQIVPFTHIRRATALHAAMKSEMFAALPNVDHDRARSLSSGFGQRGSVAPRFHDENGAQALTGGTFRSARWHRSIVIDRLNNASGAAGTPWWNLSASDRVQGTLRQFEERFNFAGQNTGLGPCGIGGETGKGLPTGFRGGLFRSASQICELHLIPSNVLTSNLPTAPVLPPGSPANSMSVTQPDATTENVLASALDSYGSRETAMALFWTNHSATGDNTRERPYSNLYAKLTTRSNTFRVHVRSQTIKKSIRGATAATVFNPGSDEVTGEFRGSFLIERYIDKADLVAAGAAVNFASSPSPLSLPPLDSYYRFRIIESKRFAP